MPVLVVADLHLDLWLQAGRDPFAGVDLSGLDALIIAGDLSNKPKVRWPHMLRHIGRYIDLSKVWLLPGNHDYYDHTIDGEDRLAAICEAEGANFVQKREFIIGGVRFLGATLWTDFALHGDPGLQMSRAEREMNDYRYIRHAADGYRRLWPPAVAMIHADHLHWLDERLSVPFEGRTVVVTHHCPHPYLVGEVRGDNDPFYASNLLAFIERHQPDEWIFGHTHNRVEAQVGRTRVRNVSLAYPFQVEPGSERAILLRGIVEAV